jgi:hypothetical protein
LQAVRVVAVLVELSRQIQPVAQETLHRHRPRKAIEAETAETACAQAVVALLPLVGM